MSKPPRAPGDLGFRCGDRGQNGEAPACGAPAVHVRPFSDPRFEHFVCADHVRTGDRPIAADEPFRLVTVAATIVLAGVSRDFALAQLEAADYLERVLAAAGVRLALRRIQSGTARRGSSASGGATWTVEPGPEPLE